MPFSTLHIALSALTVAVFAAAVAMWRLSANKPDLNDDGLPAFSANDWAVPILTYPVLGGYADLRPPPTRSATGRSVPWSPW